MYYRDGKNICIIHQSILLRIGQRVANHPLCPSEACVMLLLHLLCNYGLSLSRDACFCHPGALKKKVLGLIQSQTFHFSSLQCTAVCSGLNDSRDASTDRLWRGLFWWEHVSGLGTPRSSCFHVVGSFSPLCLMELVTDLLCLVSWTER